MYGQPTLVGVPPVGIIRKQVNPQPATPDFSQQMDMNTQNPTQMDQGNMNTWMQQQQYQQQPQQQRGTSYSNWYNQYMQKKAIDQGLVQPWSAQWAGQQSLQLTPSVDHQGYPEDNVTSGIGLTGLSHGFCSSCSRSRGRKRSAGIWVNPPAIPVMGW